jgi:hypothetical protein
MVNSRHPFVLQLAATMKDANRLYMLIELCLGGELFTYLHLNPSRMVRQQCIAKAISS